VSDVTPVMVRGLFAHMQRALGTVVKTKPDATEMRAIASFLGAMGVVDAHTFMANYATTLDHHIYLPFTPGEPLRGWTLWEQLITCAHEHQHVVQADERGIVRFAARYLASRTDRVLLEANAYCTELELHFWRFGTLPALDGYMESALAGYGARPEDVIVAQRVIERYAESVRRGAIITRAGALAIDWLNHNATEIRLALPRA
jgi:hypothetical protein